MGGMLHPVPGPSTITICGRHTGKQNEVILESNISYNWICASCRIGRRKNPQLTVLSFQRMPIPCFCLTVFQELGKLFNPLSFRNGCDLGLPDRTKFGLLQGRIQQTSKWLPRIPRKGCLRFEDLFLEFCNAQLDRSQSVKSSYFLFTPTSESHQI